MRTHYVPSLKLTNGWLEDEFPFGFRPIFRGELLVLWRVNTVENDWQTKKRTKNSLAGGWYSKQPFIKCLFQLDDGNPNSLWKNGWKSPFPPNLHPLNMVGFGVPGGFTLEGESKLDNPALVVFENMWLNHRKNRELMVISTHVNIHFCMVMIWEASSN